MPVSTARRYQSWCGMALRCALMSQQTRVAAELGDTDDTEHRIDGASILRDMQATLARHETQMQALMQAAQRQTAPAGNGLYSRNTTMPATEVAVSYQEAHTRSAQHWLTSRYPRAPYLPPCHRMTQSTG